MTECIFCKFVKDEIPCAKVYEDDKVLAFLDIAPIHEGHTLVIPKRHHKDLSAMPEEFLKHCMVAIKKIALGVQKATGADGINVGMNNGAAAGQAVFHAHFHVIPRFTGDKLSHWPRKKYKEKEIEAWSERIKDKL